MNYKHIFITGASSGIGEALSLYYATSGVTLGLLSKSNSTSLENVADLCRNKGAQVFTYTADVYDRSVITKCIRRFCNEVGFVDLVIANAGVAIVEDSSYMEIDVPMKNMMVNYFGVINTFLPFLESMKTNRFGHLVVISSISSLRSTHNSGAYSASKAAINLWVEGLRLRLMPFKVTVSTLCVGFVDTAMTRNNPFWMPGLISSDRAAKLIGKAINRKRLISVLPWQSGTIWRIFHLMPAYLYGCLITYAKNRI